MSNTKYVSDISGVWENTALRQYTSGPRFNIKMSSYKYMKSHCGDKAIVRSGPRILRIFQLKNIVCIHHHIWSNCLCLPVFFFVSVRTPVILCLCVHAPLLHPYIPPTPSLYLFHSPSFFIYNNIGIDLSRINVYSPYMISMEMSMEVWIS